MKTNSTPEFTSHGLSITRQLCRCSPGLKLNMSKTHFLHQLVSQSVRHLRGGLHPFPGTRARKLHSCFCLIYIQTPLKCLSLNSLLTAAALVQAPPSLSETTAAVTLLSIPVSKISTLSELLTAINTIFLKSLTSQLPAQEYMMASLRASFPTLSRGSYIIPFTTWSQNITVKAY